MFENGMLKSFQYILLMLLFLCASCEWKLKPNGDTEDPGSMRVERYDRLESRYLVTGDFSALQQMNIDYPMETRTLVEKMLQIGEVSEHDINERFLRFYQDSTLRVLISDVGSEFANMDDINRDLVTAFTQLKKWLPELPLPRVYSQIGALDQSIVVGDRLVGISLDKYMGAKYPLYKRFNYTTEQLGTMRRSYIVPDVVNFYLLSIYSLDHFERCSQRVRDLHVGKTMWVVNEALGRKAFDMAAVEEIDRYMSRHEDMSVRSLLEMDDYEELEKEMARTGR